MHIHKVVGSNLPLSLSHIPFIHLPISFKPLEPPTNSTNNTNISTPCPLSTPPILIPQSSTISSIRSHPRL